MGTEVYLIYNVRSILHFLPMNNKKKKAGGSTMRSEFTRAAGRIGTLKTIHVSSGLIEAACWKIAKETRRQMIILILKAIMTRITLFRQF